MRIGIIGTGKIAHRMARTAAQMEGVCVAAAAARDFEKTRAFCKTYAIARSYELYADLLRDDSIDLIYVATPHAVHYRHARDALLCGKPVLCEKPFTVNAGQAEALFALAAEKRVFITEALWTRYMPWRVFVEETIASGAIGQVRHITADIGYRNESLPRILDPAAGGGALLDIGVYALNFAAMFAGAPVARVSSDVVLCETGVDVCETVTLQFENGVTAALNATVRAQTERRGTVCGTEGYITVDNIIRGALAPGSGVRVYDAQRRETAFFDAYPAITGFEHQLRACERALGAGLLECPEATHADTLARIRLMDRLRADWGVKYPFE